MANWPADTKHTSARSVRGPSVFMAAAVPLIFRMVCCGWPAPTFLFMQLILPPLFLRKKLRIALPISFRFSSWETCTILIGALQRIKQSFLYHSHTHTKKKKKEPERNINSYEKRRIVNFGDRKPGQMAIVCLSCASLHLLNYTMFFIVSHFWMSTLSRTHWKQTENTSWMLQRCFDMVDIEGIGMPTTLFDQ